jgi:6-phosphogluconolactonase
MSGSLEVRVFRDVAEVVAEGVRRIADAARDAVELRGRFTLAFSGGRTPWRVFRALADAEIPWAELHLLQVDERVAPDGDSARNMTRMRDSLLDHVPLPAENVHPMPVGERDLERASARYGRTLETVCGADRRIDLVHLGLGADGHTASLVPEDPVLEVGDRDVATTAGAYQGHRRMTLTYPAIDRARTRLWIVTGAGKIDALAGLLAGDPGIPAGRVSRDAATLLADSEAAIAPD